MIEAIDLYWLLTIPKIGVMATIISVLLLMISWYLIFEYIERNKAAIIYKRPNTMPALYPICSIIALYFFAILATLIPSRQDILIIVGASTISQMEAAQGFGGEAGEAAVKSLELLNQYLDENLRDE